MSTKTGNKPTTDKSAKSAAKTKTTTKKETPAPAPKVEKTKDEFDQSKREASRRFKIRKDAAAIGMEVNEYAKLYFNTTVEEFVTDEFFNAIKANKGVGGNSGPSIEQLMETMEIPQVNMQTVKIDKTNLQPIKTGTALDRLFSRKDGIMPGTVNIITGESGAGKTTITTNACVYAKRLNKKLSAGCLHGEMSMLDWEEECEKNEGLRELPAVFLRNFNKYTGNEYLAAIKKALGTFRLCILDSLAVVSDRIKEQTNMSEKEAMFWLLDTMNELAESELIAFLVIQHFTKGKEYHGPARLKHDTTSMAYVLFDKSNEPFIIFHKNRRGAGLLKMPLYTKLDAKTGMLTFDDVRLADMERDLLIKKTRDADMLANKTSLEEVLSLEESFACQQNKKGKDDEEEDD